MIIDIGSFSYARKQELNVDLPESHRVTPERIRMLACNKTMDMRDLLTVAYI